MCAYVCLLAFASDAFLCPLSIVGDKGDSSKFQIRADVLKFNYHVFWFLFSRVSRTRWTRHRFLCHSYSPKHLITLVYRPLRRPGQQIESVKWCEAKVFSMCPRATQIARLKQTTNTIDIRITNSPKSHSTDDSSH